MLYSRIRFSLIFIFLTIGILLHVRVGWANAWYVYAASLILLLTHFLFGNVWMAFNLLKKGKTNQAESILQQIHFPELLLRKNRAYYFFTLGMIRLQQKNLPPATEHLSKALQLGLSTPNDQALTTLNLAHIYFVQNNYEQSQYYLEQTKELPYNDLMIQENVKKLEKALPKLN